MTVDVRAPAEDDVEEIAEVVHTSIRASYALSPQEIDRIVDEEFENEVLAEKLDDEETVLLVAETGEEVEDADVAGVVEASLDGDVGELDWLFVETAQRGKGVGTELFEAASEHLRESGAESLRASVLEANTEGQQFVERFGFEHVGERELDVGDTAHVEYLYAGPEADVESETAPRENEEVADEELPETEQRDGRTVTTAEDGTTLHLDTDSDRSGTAGPFLTAYTDADHEEEYGFYCANCGSLETAMGNMEQIECEECGNRHAPRSAEEYDDTYL